MNPLALESNGSILNSGKHEQTGCEFTPLEFTTMADLDATNVYSDPIGFDTSFVNPDISFFFPDALNPMQTDVLPADNAAVDNTGNQVLDSDEADCVDDEYAALIDSWLQEIRDQQQEKAGQGQQQQQQEQEQQKEPEQKHQQEQQHQEQMQYEGQQKQEVQFEVPEQQMQKDEEEEVVVNEDVKVGEKGGNDQVEEVVILDDDEDDELVSEVVVVEEDEQQTLEDKEFQMQKYDEGKVGKEQHIQRQEADVYKINEGVEEKDEVIVVVDDDEDVVVQEEEQEHRIQELVQDQQPRMQQQIQQEKIRKQHFQQVRKQQDQQRQQQNQRLQPQQRQQQQQHLIYIQQQQPQQQQQQPQQQQQQRQQRLQHHLYSTRVPVPLINWHITATLPSANKSINRKCKITSVPLTNIQPLNSFTKEKYCNIQITVQCNDNDKKVTGYGISNSTETNGIHHNTNLSKGYISNKKPNGQILQKSVTHSSRIQQSITNNGLTLKQKCSEVSIINSLDKVQSKERNRNLAGRPRELSYQDLSPAARTSIWKSLHYSTPRDRCVVLRPAYQIKYIQRKPRNLTIFQRNPDLLNDANRQKCKDFNSLPNDFDSIIMSVPLETNEEFAIKPHHKFRRQRKLKIPISPDSENIGFDMEYMNLKQFHKATTTCEFTLSDNDNDGQANDKNNYDNEDYDNIENYDDDDDSSKVMDDLYPDIELPEIEELFKRKKGNNTTPAATASNRNYSHKIKANSNDLDEAASKLKRKEGELKSSLQVDNNKDMNCLDGRIENPKAAKRPYVFIQSEECKYMNYSDTDSDGTVEMKERILANKSLRCDKCRKLFKTLRSLIIHIKRNICKIENNSIPNSVSIPPKLPCNR